jgi:hypothetical protein
MGFMAQLQGLRGISPKLLWLLAAPVGTLLYLRDRWRKSRIKAD